MLCIFTVAILAQVNPEVILVNLQWTHYHLCGM